jgi:hypothetical protein
MRISIMNNFPSTSLEIRDHFSWRIKLFFLLVFKSFFK